MNNRNVEQPEFSCPAWSRPEIVFVIISVTLLPAFLIPLPEILLDISWGFTFCLAGAAIIICLSAQHSSDLAGFVPVVSGLVLLRLVVLASSARRIIEQEPTGILINSFGGLIAGNRPLGAVLICLLLGVICVTVIFASCQRITAASRNYIEHVLPLKKIGLETDLHMGILNETNSKTLFRRIVSEFRFFSGMNGSSLLMRSESAICIFILLGCLILPVFSEQFQLVSGMEYIARAAPSVLALSLFTLPTGLIVSAACGSLMRKEMLTLRVEEGSSRPPAKTISLLCSETGDKEDVELINPEFVEHEDVDSRVIEFEPSFATTGADGTKPQAETAALDFDRGSVEILCHDASEYYETLCNVICTLDSKPHKALLASDRLQSLPATVAVNVAILLARQQQNVLLVDTDSRRNAIARIFEANPEDLRHNVMTSCLEKLSLFSVPAARLSEFLQDSSIAESYDTTLIYMPDSSELEVSGDLSGNKPDVFYFTRNYHDPLPESEMNRFGFAGSLRLVRDIQTALESMTCGSAASSSD